MHSFTPHTSPQKTIPFRKKNNEVSYNPATRKKGNKSLILKKKNCHQGNIGVKNVRKQDSSESKYCIKWISSYNEQKNEI